MTPARTLNRDYKHVRRNTPGGQAFTGWMGLTVGLALGLTVALGVFLHYRNVAPAEPTPEANVPPASARASEEAPPPAADPASNFDFYKMLPEQEVEVPKNNGSASPPLPAALRGDVTLQAGSFKSQDQAEKMQARLALQGIESKIQRFTLDDETWYRVRIGPVATVEELEALRTKLAEADIDVAPTPGTAEMPPP